MSAIGDKLLTALTSTECIAAFLGACAAFLMEALRRWWSDRRDTLAAGNEAVFALAQMFAHITNVYNQQFVEQAKVFREMANREPNYAEILPLELGDGVARLRFERLGFLLRSHDPDLLNRLAAADSNFGVLTKVIERRNEAQVQWQRATAAVFAQNLSGSPIPFETLERLVGMDLSFRLKNMTEELQRRLPECSKELRSAGQQLTRVLSLVFPMGRVNSFIHVERENAVTPPSGIPKPPLWRRFIRGIVRLMRTKIF